MEDNQIFKTHKNVLTLERRKRNNVCKFHKFGYCKLKDKCEKEHVNRECPDGSHCKGIQTWALRHPKMCKRIGMQGLCHFRENCAYNHKRKDNWKSDHKNDLHDGVNKHKGEIDSLKKTIQPLINTREKLFTFSLFQLLNTRIKPKAINAYQGPFLQKITL